jgi:hypothetical protein
MKTAEKTRCLTVQSNRNFGVEGQNRSCSITWAAKQEKPQPLEECFFLTPTFIELIGSQPSLATASFDKKFIRSNLHLRSATKVRVALRFGFFSAHRCYLPLRCLAASSWLLRRNDRTNPACHPFEGVIRSLSLSGRSLNSKQEKAGE